MSSYEEGKVLLIDKPLHWTSFDAVRKIRNIIRIKKVGHAGTLDPLATGLLIICTGKFTKKINEYMAKEKEYTGTFTLGATTPTYDLESEPGNFQSAEHLSESEIHAATRSFIGEILQTPPAHSAIKVEGRRVYELARQGKEVKLEPRKITIMEFEIKGIARQSPSSHPASIPEEKRNFSHKPSTHSPQSSPDSHQDILVHFRVVCSTGTYIRSLANDFGKALGCGAYLSSLRRTRIGEFRVEDACTMEEFIQMNKE